MLAGVLEGADQLPAPRPPGQNQRPAPCASGAGLALSAQGQKGLARELQPTSHQPDLYCPGLI